MKLILHIGPAKCGSTSIQKFFFTQKDPCVEKTHYLLLNPKEIRELDSVKPTESIIAKHTKLLLDNISGCDTLILSHEVLFQCPYAVKNICDLAKPFGTEINIIGYSRRQSDFLVSAYSQWHYRSLPRIKIATDILNKLEIDPVLFSGLEQHLIASIANDFEARNLQDWYNSYKAISQLVSNANTVIKCGVLPKRGSKVSLIQDFCEKANLTLQDRMKDASWIIANPSFNEDIVEAINNAVSFGFVETPEFHVNNIVFNKEINEVIFLLSGKVDAKVKKHQSFLSKLKAYVDTYYLNSNHRLCQEYGLDEAYFAPSLKYSKQEILDIIAGEAQQRSMNKTIIINDYRMLSAGMADLCLKLAFDVVELKKHCQTLNNKYQSLVQSSNESFFKKIYRKLYAKVIGMYQRLRLFQL